MAVAKRCEHQIDLCQCRLTAARFGPSWISAAFSGLVATAGFECKRLLKAGDVGAFRTDPPGVLPGRPGSIAFDLVSPQRRSRSRVRCHESVCA